MMEEDSDVLSGEEFSNLTAKRSKLNLELNATASSTETSKSLLQNINSDNVYVPTADVSSIAIDYSINEINKEVDSTSSESKIIEDISAIGDDKTSPNIKQVTDKPGPSGVAKTSRRSSRVTNPRYRINPSIFYDSSSSENEIENNDDLSKQEKQIPALNLEVNSINQINNEVVDSTSSGSKTVEDDISAAVDDKISPNNKQTIEKPGPSGTAKTSRKSSRFTNRNYRINPSIFSYDSSSSSEDEIGNNDDSSKPEMQIPVLNLKVPDDISNIFNNIDNSLSSSLSTPSLQGTSLHETDSVSTISDALLPRFSSEDGSDSSDESGDAKNFKGFSEQQADIKKNILDKPKPKYTWIALPELLYRQNGISGRGRRTISGRNAIDFENRMYGSLHAVERLELMLKLEKHNGCVNCLHFNKSGNLLVTGSDDLKIILWKWCSNEIAEVFESGHNSNVFQTKFLDFIGCGINIASSSRDGHVRLNSIPPSGGKPISTLLVKHSSAVHKIALTPSNPYELLSAGEDGRVVRCDLRDKSVEKLVTVRCKKRKVALYSIANHPLDPEFCVSGRDQFVRVFDKRNVKTPTKLFCPDHQLNKRLFSTHITCAVYNYLGNQILASTVDDIYLFDNTQNTPGAYLHKYSGHRNSSTIKGVNFFGPRSEFIMSGSDCGNCFFWDKKTEAIVQWMAADEIGTVNCLEPHPSFPMLATSGLDHDIKIWVPSHEQPPAMCGLKKCVSKNMAQRYAERSTNDEVFDDQVLSFYVRQCLRTRRERSQRDSIGQLFPSDSDRSQDEEDNPPLFDRFRSLPCSPS